MYVALANGDFITPYSSSDSRTTSENPTFSLNANGVNTAKDNKRSYGLNQAVH